MILFDNSLDGAFEAHVGMLFGKLCADIEREAGDPNGGARERFAKSLKTAVLAHADATKTFDDKSLAAITEGPEADDDYRHRIMTAAGRGHPSTRDAVVANGAALDAVGARHGVQRRVPGTDSATPSDSASGSGSLVAGAGGYGHSNMPIAVEGAGIRQWPAAPYAEKPGAVAETDPAVRVDDTLGDEVAAP